MQSNYDSENVLIVRIGCEKHDVDAETVISLMQATVSLIQVANRTVCPEGVIQIKVSPFVPGSFEILYHFVPTGTAKLKRMCLSLRRASCLLPMNIGLNDRPHNRFRYGNRFQRAAARYARCLV